MLEIGNSILYLAFDETFPTHVPITLESIPSPNCIEFG